MTATNKWLVMGIAGLRPEIDGPDPERVISGSSKFRIWHLEQAGNGLYAGVWEATPGKWRVVSAEWEYSSILSGHSIVTEDGGHPVHLRAGDRMILRPGFKGTWEVRETTYKDYVVRL